MKAFLLPAFALLLTACQQPYSTAYYSTWWPRSISRIPVSGGTPTAIVPGVVSEALAIDQKAEVLYSGTEGSINRWSLDGKLLGSFNPPKHERAIAIDVKGGQLFIAEEKNSHDIVRTDLDGKNLKVVVKDARYCDALAFDGKRGTLYYSREHPSGVWRVNADGSNIQPVATEVMIPSAIAVDESGKQMYWACSDFATGTSHIKRANLDGTKPVTLLEKLPQYIEALTIDSAAGRMFWIERPSNDIQKSAIMSAKLDGTDVRTLQEFAKGNWARALVLGWLPGERN